MSRFTRTVVGMLRVGFLEALAYRVELVIWMLTTTMPLVMLPLWIAVANDGAVGGFDRGRFIAYFLTAFVVRQCTGVWALWTMHEDIKQGSLALRLMRPIHPFWAYAVESLAALPIRIPLALPAIVIAAIAVDGALFPRSAVLVLVGVLATVGAWLIAFFAQATIGSLALFLQSSLKVGDLWFAGYFVLSGYIVPLRLFPAGLAAIPRWTPYPYLLSFPVEVWLGEVPLEAALAQLAIQWSWALALAVLASVLWRRGLHRHAVVGG